VHLPQLFPHVHPLHKQVIQLVAFVMLVTTVLDSLVLHVMQDIIKPVWVVYALHVYQEHIKMQQELVLVRHVLVGPIPQRLVLSRVFLV
jgi:hypothetical protein